MTSQVEDCVGCGCGKLPNRELVGGHVPLRKRPGERDCAAILLGALADAEAAEVRLGGEASVSCIWALCKGVRLGSVRGGLRVVFRLPGGELRIVADVPGEGAFLALGEVWADAVVLQKTLRSAAKALGISCCAMYVDCPRLARAR
jgi:hypothetical protein